MQTYSWSAETHTKRWILLLGAMFLGGGLAYFPLSCSSSKPSGTGMVQTVPPQGLVMNQFNGTTTPVPIAFYPNGQIYGMVPVAGTKTGQAAMALEGTYDDPQTVAAYYQRFYQETTNAQSLHVDVSNGPAAGTFLWKAHAYNLSGFMIITVWTDPKGLSRDITKWATPYAPPSALTGGDPRETMIWSAIKWK